MFLKLACFLGARGAICAASGACNDCNYQQIFIVKIANFRSIQLQVLHELCVPYRANRVKFSQHLLPRPIKYLTVNPLSH